MKSTKRSGYLTPEVEVLEMAVEQGFNGSLGGDDSNTNNPMDNPDVENENDW